HTLTTALPDSLSRAFVKRAGEDVHEPVLGRNDGPLSASRTRRARPPATRCPRERVRSTHDGTHHVSPGGRREHRRHARGLGPRPTPAPRGAPSLEQAPPPRGDLVAAARDRAVLPRGRG